MFAKKRVYSTLQSNGRKFGRLQSQAKESVKVKAGRLEGRSWSQGKVAEFKANCPMSAKPEAGQAACNRIVDVTREDCEGNFYFQKPLLKSEPLYPTQLRVFFFGSILCLK